MCVGKLVILNGVVFVVLFNYLVSCYGIIIDVINWIYIGWDYFYFVIGILNNGFVIVFYGYGNSVLYLDKYICLIIDVVFWNDYIIVNFMGNEG